MVQNTPNYFGIAEFCIFDTYRTMPNRSELCRIVRQIPIVHMPFLQNVAFESNQRLATFRQNEGKL